MQLSRLLQALALLMLSFANQANAEISNQLGLTAEEIAWLEQHPVIRVGVDAYPPFEIIDNKDRFTVISADYLDEILQRLGIKFACHLGAGSEIVFC